MVIVAKVARFRKSIGDTFGTTVFPLHRPSIDFGQTFSMACARLSELFREPNNRRTPASKFYLLSIVKVALFFIPP
jgi:hypothetical protein